MIDEQEAPPNSRSLNGIDEEAGAAIASNTLKVAERRAMLPAAPSGVLGHAVPGSQGSNIVFVLGERDLHRLAQFALRAVVGLTDDHAQFDPQLVKFVLEGVEVPAVPREPIESINHEVADLVPTLDAHSERLLELRSVGGLSGLASLLEDAYDGRSQLSGQLFTLRSLKLQARVFDLARVRDARINDRTVLLRMSVAV